MQNEVRLFHAEAVNGNNQYKLVINFVHALMQAYRPGMYKRITEHETSQLVIRVIHIKYVLKIV